MAVGARFVGTLGSRSPKFYLLCYLAVVFIFALCFWLIRDQFYHPYARYEGAMYAEEQNLRVSLTSALRDAAQGRPLQIEGTSIVADSIRVGKIDAEEDHLVIHVGMTFMAGPPDWHCELYTHTVMKLPPVAVKEQRPDGSQALMIFPQLPDPLVTLFIPKSAGDVGASPTQVSILPVFMRIYVSEGDLERLRGYTAGRAGFPSRVPNSFGRLLYLSVVTITTLGYGDVVPLSDLARGLCGLEATIGIILLGLFISILTTRKAGHQGPSSSPSEVQP
jgi:hypothetical protein